MVPWMTMHIIEEKIPKYIGFKQVCTLVPILLMKTNAIAELIAPLSAEQTPRAK